MVVTCIECATEYDQPPPWCWSCGSTMLVSPGRRRLANIDSEAEVSDARALAASAWNLIEVPAYAALRLLHGGLVLVYGMPGAGKSTWALRASASMAGPQVLLAAEERLSASLGERLQRLGIRSANYRVVGRSSVDQLVEVCRGCRARVLVIDSVSVGVWLPTDVRHLIQRLGLDALIAVQHVTKAGLPAGSHGWAHEADVAVEVTEGRWVVRKTRYGELGTEGDVL